MTGSEHTSTSSTNDKPSTLGKEIKLEENVEQINEGASSPSSSSSPLEGDKSLGSSNNSSNVISHAPPSTQKGYSDFTAHYTKESMVGKESGLCRTAGTNRSSMSHPTMKRTISNCTVRSHNASTLCSQGSSYVYHYPSNVARKNHQQQQQHRSIQPSPTPSSLMVTSIATNFYLPLCEDTSSDETQSMVELSQEPSRMRAQHRASVRREKEGSENGHTSTRRTTHRGAGQPQAAVRDNLQHSNHQKHEKLHISKRQLDCTQPKASSHIDLERTCGNLAVYGEQKQLLHNYHHQQPHHHTLHRLTNHHQQMMRSHLDLSRGWSSSPKSHTWQTHSSSSNTCRVNGGVAQASIGQDPRHHTLRSTSVSSASDKRITLHIPSGRKHESLI